MDYQKFQNVMHYIIIIKFKPIACMTNDFAVEDESDV